MDELQAARREIEKLKHDRRAEEEGRWSELFRRIRVIEENQQTTIYTNQSQTKILESVDKTINGTAESPERGLKIRVDRLESAYETQKYVLRLVLGTTITAFILWMWKLVTGKQ